MFLLCYCSLLFSHYVMSNSVAPWNSACQASLLSLSPWVCSNSCPLSRWNHPTISSSVIPFSSCPQSFPASGSFPMSWLFTSGGQSIGVSASASVLPWIFPLGLTGLISLLSKEICFAGSSLCYSFHYLLLSSFCFSNLLCFIIESLNNSVLGVWGSFFLRICPEHCYGCVTSTELWMKIS